MRVHLLELDLVLGDRYTSSIEDQEAGAGGSLVDRTDKGIAFLRLSVHSDERGDQQAHR